MAQTHARRDEFLAGMRDMIPMVVGGIPFGIIFGALAATGGATADGSSAAKLSPAGVLAMSAFVFAGSAQFIAAGMVKAQASVLLIIITTFIVNLRHLLYSASLGPYLKRLPQRWLIPLGFWLTDETFLIVINRFHKGSDEATRHWYYLGSCVIMYVDWQVSTLVGVIAGQTIPNPGQWGLDFALIVTFIGMIVPAIKNRSSAAAVIVAGVVAVAANGLPNKVGLILAALSGVAAGMLVRIWLKETPAVIATSEEAA